VIRADSVFTRSMEQLATLTVRNSLYREFAAAGGLAGLGTEITESYRMAGIYTGPILKGEKPADLPVVQSTKFEDQPEDRQGARHNRVTASVRSRRRVDRITALICCIALGLLLALLGSGDQTELGLLIGVKLTHCRRSRDSRC
jgi:hypothetical protein